MNRDDFAEPQSAALRLRCIRVLINIDDESLRIVDSVLGRLVPSTPKLRSKPRASETGPKTTTAGTEPKGGVK